MANADSAASLVTQPQDEPQAPVVRAPIDVRSVSLAILPTLGVIVFVRWAGPVLIPIAIAVLFNYALTPIVTWLHKRLLLPKVVGAAITLGSILLVLGFGVTRLQPQALDILDIVPRAVQKLTTVMRGNAREPENAVDKVKKAAKEIERAANEVAGPSTPAPAIAPAKPPQAAPTFNVGEYMLRVV